MTTEEIQTDDPACGLVTSPFDAIALAVCGVPFALDVETNIQELEDELANTGRVRPRGGRAERLDRERMLAARRLQRNAFRWACYNSPLGSEVIEIAAGQSNRVQGALNSGRRGTLRAMPGRLFDDLNANAQAVGLTTRTPPPDYHVLLDASETRIPTGKPELVVTRKTPALSYGGRRTLWPIKTPRPDEALLISGLRKRKDQPPFRVVQGRGTFVMPVSCRVHRISFRIQEAVIEERCLTKNKLPVQCNVVVAFCVGHDETSVTRAATRFLGQEDRMHTLVGKVVAGHLRSLVGQRDLDELVSDRTRVTQELIEMLKPEINQMGLTIDYFRVSVLAPDPPSIASTAPPQLSALKSAAELQQRVAAATGRAEQNAVAATRALH